LFEVGEGRAVRGEARGAGPETPCNPPHAGNRFKRLKRTHLLLGALALGLALGAIEETARRAGYTPDMEHMARVAGFGIDQVALTGHRFSYDGDIFDALDLGNVRFFGSLDTAAVKSRIERLPWIDTAELTRVYPGRLEIRVTERRPYALWSRADRLYLIDKTGRVLAAVSGETLPELPQFAGEGAATEAASLLETVARYPEVASRLARAERVSERRWRLKLDNGTTLELPADNEVGALEGLSRDSSLAKLVAEGRTTLDFRGPGRVAVRPDAEAAASAAASPNPGS